jgi:tetratricopeptide (TPR) repeat protein
VPYHIISNIIFVGAVVGSILLVLRRLPEAAQTEAHEHTIQAAGGRGGPEVEQRSISSAIYFHGRALMLVWSKRIWQFALEAKGMKKPAAVNSRIKRIFGSSSHKRETALAAMDDVSRVTQEAAKDEEYYLGKIKEHPHEWELYRDLGQFYLGAQNYTDAQNVFEYLIKRDPGNATYYAKLGYCKLNLKLYSEAVVMYEKSVALDSGHANRYYNLALAYKMLGRTPEGKGAIAKALRLEPTNKKYQDMPL